MVSVEGGAMRPVTLVTLEEVARGGWGIAGKALHTAPSRLTTGDTAP
jgi:phenylpyruvate tautomerase PptA (4-oxalocrotonate tautomerase family)